MLVGVQGPPRRGPRHLDAPPAHIQTAMITNHPTADASNRGTAPQATANRNPAEPLHHWPKRRGSATAQKTYSERPQLGIMSVKQATPGVAHCGRCDAREQLRSSPHECHWFARAPGHDAERSVASPLSRGESALRPRPRVPRQAWRRERSFSVRQAWPGTASAGSGSTTGPARRGALGTQRGHKRFKARHQSPMPLNYVSAGGRPIPSLVNPAQSCGKSVRCTSTSDRGHPSPEPRCPSRGSAVPAFHPSWDAVRAPAAGAAPTASPLHSGDERLPGR